MSKPKPHAWYKITPVLAVFLLSTVWISPAHADPGFKAWIEDFNRSALKAGIKHSIYTEVFKGISAPDPKVLSAANYQPEFVTPVWAYLDTRIDQNVIKTGQAKAQQYKTWLDLIETRFGVNRYVLLAIWSMESAYGAALKRPSVLRSVIRSLATLAYADPKRRKFARAQLIAAMRIVQNGDITAKDLVGSWAGAMGHTQFIPTSYQQWAVDIDDDGKRDIWNSPADALASAANLLMDNGWRKGETWGYEVKLPSGFDYSKANGDGLRLGQWQALGVQRVNGAQYPRLEQQAILKLLGGAKGPAFLMLKNFFVIKRYNNADKYALAVGHLTDRLMGRGDFSATWPRDAATLNNSERKELQTLLAAAGFYTGEIDGAIGPQSQAGIRQYQIKNAIVADGFATTQLLEQMRKSGVTKGGVTKTEERN